MITKKRKIVVIIIAILALFGLVFCAYAYKLRSLMAENNAYFGNRCREVNPYLIKYKNYFLVIADLLNNPDMDKKVEFQEAWDGYTENMKLYIEKETEWLRVQRLFLDRKDIGIIWPKYLKELGNAQLKMYEGYRDDAKYILATAEKNDPNLELTIQKRDDARQRRDYFTQIYFDKSYEFTHTFEWRKILLTSVPTSSECNEENLNIPDTSGAIKAIK